MKSDLKFYILILFLIQVTMAKRKKSSKRNRTSRLKEGRREWSVALITTSTTTTEEPIAFPYGMVCISRKSHRSMALKVTEECCHKIGVACKQTDHIGQPEERNCVAENRRQFKNMKSCCRKKKKTWKKGHVEDGIDCNHRLENVTESTKDATEHSTTLSTTISVFPVTTSTNAPTSTFPTKATTLRPTTIKTHPKPISHHHVQTSRPHHVTNKPHHHLTTTKAITTILTTTTTTTTTTTKKPTKKINSRNLDLKRKALKLN